MPSAGPASVVMILGGFAHPFGLLDLSSGNHEFSDEALKFITRRTLRLQFLNVKIKQRSIPTKNNLGYQLILNEF
jgi:hypothetical protein